MTEYLNVLDIICEKIIPLVQNKLALTTILFLESQKMGINFVYVEHIIIRSSYLDN